eukprot:gene38491-47533_t
MDAYDAELADPKSAHPRKGLTTSAHPDRHYFLRIPIHVPVELCPPVAQNRFAWNHEGVSCSACRMETIVGY